MKLELHILQNFAPSNLNRDDTGAPKDCDLGGYRRARISSQCQKRAIRNAFELAKLVAPEDMGARTKRLVLQVAQELERAHQHDPARARALAKSAIEGVGLGLNKKANSEDDKYKTEYLLFVPRRIIGELAALLDKHKAVLDVGDEADKTEEPAEAAATEAPAKGGAKGAKKDKKREKKDAQAAYPKEVREGVEALLEKARHTVDVALFGRMIADKPEWNIDASCQVAHAISTNSVKMDFDFFTAVDDLKPGDTAGSDMMGTVQFNSSCFYRYAVLDVDALRANLDGGDAPVGRAVDAFVRGFLTAIPTGKQNSMAAHNPPSYALAVVRNGGSSVSLTNAFLKPARPQGEDVDLVDDSIKKLEQYARRLEDVVGDAQRLSWADRDLPASTGAPTRVERLGEFYETVARLAGGASS